MCYRMVKRKKKKKMCGNIVFDLFSYILAMRKSNIGIAICVGLRKDRERKRKEINISALSIVLLATTRR
jgi:NADH:ubiquinone oxidoreductase subunit K